MTIEMIEHRVRKVLEVPHWNQEAACKTLPMAWFISPDGTLSNRDKWLLRAGVNACNTICPIKDACLKQASVEDRQYTVRGGVFPTGVSERYRGRPGFSGKSRNARTDTHCVNGHHLETVGMRPDGRCRQCKRESEARSRQRATKEMAFARKARTAPVTPEEIEAGQCTQGHGIRQGGALSKTFRCTSCLREAKRAQDREYRSANPRSRKAAVDMSTVQLADDTRTLVVLDAHHVGTLPT